MIWRSWRYSKDRERLPGYIRCVSVMPEIETVFTVKSTVGAGMAEFCSTSGIKRYKKSYSSGDGLGVVWVFRDVECTRSIC